MLIRLDYTSKTPLYEQIYKALAGEIQAGRIAGGLRLPSKRALCAQLKVSLSTVETAYGILVSEGYLEARAKSGFYVRDVPALAQPVSPPTQSESPRPQPPAPAYDFSTGAVDTSRFPYPTWAKITKETVYQCPHLLQRGDSQGDEHFRAALADFLRQYRGVRCSPGQIVIGAGMEYLLELLLSLLPPSTSFALEDPGYKSSWNTISQRGFPLVPIGVGGDGMDLDSLEACGADIAYVTPSHQFPMGVTMPIGRRMRLLSWAARQSGRYIIEDDYDSEFRYSTRPIPALQGLDGSGKVIYFGTFSRGLAPSIRVAYMVLPPALLEVYKSRFNHASSTVSRLEQETLRRFLEGGFYARHLRRMNTYYRQKQERLTEKLMCLPGARISGSEAGLHFLLTLPSLTEEQMVERAAARDIRLRGLSRYCHRVSPPPSTVVMGFAGLDTDTLDTAANTLVSAFSQLPG